MYICAHCEIDGDGIVLLGMRIKISVLYAASAVYVQFSTVLCCNNLLEKEFSQNSINNV